MKRPLSKTKVTVKLRRGAVKGTWYLQLEAYPVIKPGYDKPQRIVESLNRMINTPVWDRTSSTRSGMPKVKRDTNGIIMCRSSLDQESCIFADNVRKLRQHEYDTAALYTGREEAIAEQSQRSNQDFIAYFKKITTTVHPNSSDSIINNWTRVGELLSYYTNGRPVPFSIISVKWLENLRLFMLKAPQGGGKSGTISQSTASTYFSIVKAGLKQAFVDEYLTTDISEKVKGIPSGEKQRVALTIEEVNQLVATPCQSDVLKRAFLFSVLTGMRHCDIKSLRWGQIEQVENGYRIGFTQKKTSVPEYLPISEQALALCGDRKSDNRLVFEGLQDPSWINRPLALWVKQAGITKHITFHCARHTFATLQITNGTDIYTVSKMLGHTNVRTTQIYAKVVDEKKEQAANAIRLKEPEHKDKDDC